MDMLCQRLDMDPLEFRKRNASVTGSTMPIGTPFPVDRPHHHPRARAASTPAGAIRCPRAASRAGAGWRSATGAARR